MRRRRTAKEGWALVAALVLAAAPARGQATAPPDPIDPPPAAPASAPAPDPTEPVAAGPDPTESAPASPVPVGSDASERSSESAGARRRKRGFYWALDGGYAYQNLFGVSMNGVDLVAILGNDRGAYSGGALFEVIPGVTEDGLKTFTLSVGPTLQVRLDQLRLGGGLRVGLFNVERARSGSLFSLTAGGYVLGSLDIISIQEERSEAIYLVVKGSLDSVDASLFGATVGLGLRY